MAFRQPGLKRSFESFRFLLGPTVHQPIVCISTPREFQMYPRHPDIKCIVHEKIGQNRANHAPYTKGNFRRLWVPIRRFGTDPKELEYCGEW